MRTSLTIRDCGSEERYGKQPSAGAAVRLFGMNLNLSHAWPTEGGIV